MPSVEGVISLRESLPVKGKFGMDAEFSHQRTRMSLDGAPTSLPPHQSDSLSEIYLRNSASPSPVHALSLASLASITIKNRPLHYHRNTRDDYSRGSTLLVLCAQSFLPTSYQNLFIDDNGITEPDWGHSEVVFSLIPNKAFPANMLLSGLFLNLLVSSTFFLFY